MKVAQVITRMDTIGGAQIHVRDLANHLAASGCEVSIITGAGTCVHKHVNVSYYQCPSLKRELHPFYDVRAIFEVRKLLKIEKPDIVATHSSKAGLIGRIAAWSLRIPTVFTAHGWAFTEGVSVKKRKLYVIIEKIIGKITNQVITVSDYDRNLAISKHVLPPHKIKTVHNGVLLLKQVNQIEPRDESQINILMVARFDVPKRQLSLIKACEKLIHLPWFLSFVGDGGQLEKTQEYVNANHLHDRVIFYGAMKSIEIPLSKAEIFVLISDYEGLPLCILEAMQAGLPIIATDVGGVKEAVSNSGNGFLIPKGDEASLLHQLKNLLTDVSLREAMGTRSKLLYNEKFTFERMYVQTMQVYEKVLQNQPEKGKHS
ncbi:glycosyltransferase family 4 protein [Paenisporosarcina sp. TG20]|uniref:glycosyltransferase family 4 protein n=1 Tax=Paenisporosarcina sp. TG20 TaxID=1211706 RepID=UPI0002D3AB9E|nr:glycosyltransferase family 4 protein [Paenisporosarcina sp. TG20]